MPEQTVSHGTFVIERSYPTTPERIFAAFSDPVKKRRWFVEGPKFEVQEFEIDFRVGGRERSSFRAPLDSPIKGAIITNDTVYQDIVPNRRMVIAYTMTVGDHRISASLATFELLPGAGSTRLIFTEQAAFFEHADGPKMREEGWRELLEQLAQELAS
jgi:uncharacterized protein YndB with AHSA1/START domain